MSIKKITAAGKRLGAAVGIVSNVAASPISKDGTPDLVKQYAKYSKQVRLPEIGREIRRNTTKSMNPTASLDRRDAKKLRKP